jgi:hypothetical protein
MSCCRSGLLAQGRDSELRGFGFSTCSAGLCITAAQADPSNVFNPPNLPPAMAGMRGQRRAGSSFRDYPAGDRRRPGPRA